ncbi:hypothetical protein AGR6A_Cc140223 [Agrobacterium sp. NCPPB 925]|nr:hypothetical protein AGR6A_Cc140223 [Agrobacterium sp. NCPPB 925]
MPPAVNLQRLNALHVGLPGLQFCLSPSPCTCILNHAAELRRPEFLGLVTDEPTDLGSLNPMRVVDGCVALPSDKSLQNYNRNRSCLKIEGFVREFFNFPRKSKACLRPWNSFETSLLLSADSKSAEKRLDAYRLHMGLWPGLYSPEGYLNLLRNEFYMALNGGIDHAIQSGAQLSEMKMGRLAGRPIWKWLDLLAQVPAAWPQIRSKKPWATCRPDYPEIQQENRSLSSLTREPLTVLARPYLPERLLRVLGETGIGAERIGLRGPPPTFAST